MCDDNDPALGRAGLHKREEDVVQSHQGAVTAICPTPDGLHWLSAGTDDRLRLWDALDWHHWLVGYPGTRNKATRARQLTVGVGGEVVFHPCGSSIQVRSEGVRIEWQQLFQLVRRLLACLCGAIT